MWVVTSLFRNTLKKLCMKCKAAALEIAESLSDKPFSKVGLLLDRFGGSIGQTTRLGIRFRLNLRNSKKGRDILIELVEGLSGYGRNTLRLAHFKKLCKVLSIVYKPCL
uniref:Uncharacterized protein n=1 Tax=Tupiella akineta TaxID=160070 RepID=Q6UVQ5_TUPAK|nr:hypothetical protein PsakpMp56 [Tupiella akineta]AAQ18769.1 hypothetical protein [Tupiella akineta]